MNNEEISEYVDLMAKLIDLPLNAENRPSVIANMTRIAEIAQLITEFPLSDEIEVATVFQP